MDYADVVDERSGVLTEVKTAEPAPTRRDGPVRDRRPTRWLLVAAGAAVALRLAMVLTHPVITSPDTNRYRNPADVWLPFQVWEPKAGPGVLSQLLFLLPMHAAAGAQVMCSGLLWGWLAFLFTRGRASRLLPTCVIAWSLTPWSTLWDSWLITEAVALPATALCVVASILALRRPRSWPVWAAALSGASIAVATRPVLIVLLVPVLALAVAFGVLRAATRRQVYASGAIVGVLLVFGAWQTIQFERTPGNDMAAVRARDRLIGRGERPGYLDLARGEGMPACPDVAAAVKAPTDRHVIRYSQCPGYQRWLARGGLPWTTELAHNTGPTLAAFADPGYWTGYPFNVDTYGDAYRNWWGAYSAFGRHWSLFARALNLTILAAIAVSTAIGLRRRETRVLAIGLYLVLTGFAFGMWISDGVEYWRHVLPALYTAAPAGWALWQLGAGRSGRRRPRATRRPAAVHPTGSTECSTARSMTATARARCGSLRAVWWAIAKPMVAASAWGRAWPSSS